MYRTSVGNQKVSIKYCSCILPDFFLMLFISCHWAGRTFIRTLCSYPFQKNTEKLNLDLYFELNGLNVFQINQCQKFNIFVKWSGRPRKKEQLDCIASYHRKWLNIKSSKESKSDIKESTWKSERSKRVMWMDGKRQKRTSDQSPANYWNGCFSCNCNWIQSIRFR